MRHPLLSLFLFVLCCAGLSPHDSLAQIKISCKAPDITRWRGEMALSMEAGKQDCEEASRLAKRASELRDDVKEHGKKADTESKRAKDLRDQADDRRKEAERRTKEATDVLNEARREVNRLQEHSDAIATWRNALSVRIPFRVGTVDTVAVPQVQGIESDAARNDAIASFETYAAEVTGLAEGESEAVDQLAQLLDQEANSLASRADLHEQRAARYRSTVLAAEQAASRLEIAARVSEDAALLHQMNAALQFMAQEQGNADARKEVDRAIKFVETNLGRLPVGVMQQASALLSSSRAGG
ncbi:MAG: hypothetical protein SH809_11430 [Rhodothermales bacterium]|nr:hypothetical protein [Rhodothermales bacterium]